MLSDLVNHLGHTEQIYSRLLRRGSICNRQLALQGAGVFVVGRGDSGSGGRCDGRDDGDGGCGDRTWAL
ncbi:Hypothetical predicted protein [Octopus vulgaris]|uniref:Uncharacterized protein n=1 Tax=Octopus vulgaris TaxID=6645 RepID=A0AA36B9H8_OCTVU|nr:Hypothetical predicted protein [Octopus vulgaris]